MYNILPFCFASRALTLGIVLSVLGACTPIPHIADTSSETSSHTTVVLPARPKSNVVTIEWMSPSPAEANIPEIGGKIEIKIRITSANPVNQDEIDIYINGVLLGSKAGEVSLMRRPDFKDNILVMQVPLSNGANAIQAVVTKGPEQRFFAERTFIKDNSGIRVKPVSSGGLSTITWVDPDLIMLRGEMFSTKNKDLAVRFNINCPENIKMENIKIFVNKKGYAPKAAASLAGEKGNFIFKDVVSLDENVDINEIHLRVETLYGSFESESLKINYAPVRPNIYLLSIGARLNLKYAYKDARDFALLYSRQHRNTNSEYG